MALTCVTSAGLSAIALAAQQRSFVASFGSDAANCQLATPCRSFNAAIAQTLVHLGIDFAGIVTRSSLSSGLRYALERQGVELASERRGHAPANDGPRGERA